jgi:heme exporter protein C
LGKREEFVRERVIYVLAAVAAVLLARNLYTMFMNLPDEAQQGAVYRIMFFHVPSAMASFAGVFVALGASLAYLGTNNLKYDSFAAATTEVTLAFATMNIVTGSIWARNQWGIWWTWDHRLTSTFIGWLLYIGYMMLRRAVDEPHQRAKFSAVLSTFAAVDVVIIWKSIEWWRNQHPGPVLDIRTGGGKIDPAMQSTLYWNLLALLLLGVVLVMVRMRQEEMQREIASMRQVAHAL